MKKTIITLLLMFSLVSFAQTTDAEYTYLSKGIKTSIENGLDIKAGYELKSLLSKKISNYQFDFYSFRRVQKNEVAAILIVAKNNVSDETFYYCNPIENNDLLTKYFKEIERQPESMTTALCVAISQLVFVNID